MVNCPCMFLCSYSTILTMSRSEDLKHPMASCFYTDSSNSKEENMAEHLISLIRAVEVVFSLLIYFVIVVVVVWKHNQ